jgi:hypothetical protein
MYIYFASMNYIPDFKHNTKKLMAETVYTDLCSNKLHKSVIKKQRK